RRAQARAVPGDARHRAAAAQAEAREVHAPASAGKAQSRLSTSIGFPVPGYGCRYVSRILRRLIAAPDDVQVGPKQQEIVAVQLTRRVVRHVEYSERRAQRPQRLFQRRGRSEERRVGKEGRGRRWEELVT